MSGPVYWGAGGQNRDKAEPEIVEAFRRAGATVMRHNGRAEPDLVVGWRGVTHLVEVKSGAKPKLTDDQTRWHACWQGEPVQVVRSIEDAARLLREWEIASAVQNERKRRVNEMEAPEGR